MNIRTCSDSGKALTELLQYFAADGDLVARETETMDQPDSCASPGVSNVVKVEFTAEINKFIISAGLHFRL